jgi:hypothetical protein
MGAVMKIKVCQLACGAFSEPNHWFSRYAEPCNRTYCEIHGYEYAVEKYEKPLRSDRGVNWEKVLHILRNLHDCDYLFYLDADALFWAHTIAIHEELVPRIGDCEIMVPVDVASERSRWNTGKANVGVGLYKNTENCRKIVQDWDTASERPECEKYRSDSQLDQGGFNDYILPKYWSQIKLLKEYYLMGGYLGLFIRHWYAQSHVTRERAFKEFYESPLMERNRRLCGSQQ